ncbi:RsmB/NOP family class I SAM-dependent RNA methyltransferase [Brevibacterium litoralis]|uniref:RsmB/NOP family class I SAM-dependent RNA methyltransferase n=1 Tax=Brevibacterium litoralis TaxID=3138935 RepID=UPI0032EE3019
MSPTGSGAQKNGKKGHGGTPRNGRPKKRKPGPRGPVRTPQQNPRRVAWKVLTEVAVEDAYANLVLPQALGRAGIGGPDAAFATELTYGTLRGLGLYDAVIADAAGRPVAKIDPPVLAAMRMGAHQVLGMRTPAHAAVAETVNLLKRTHARATGFTNAVMRRVTERTREEWIEHVTAGASEETALMIRTSHPEWIVRALGDALDAHGRDRSELPALLEADNTPARVSLTALPGLADRDAIAAAHGAPAALSPLGVLLDHGDPLSVPEVAAGTARVQDEGSQLVALALTRCDTAPAPAFPAIPAGDWFDMCAGPGGKTAVLAAELRARSGSIPAGASAAGEGGVRRVVATDASEHRAGLVVDSTRAVLRADGSPWVDVQQADGREFGHTHPQSFSRVLVDVPCSGLGALRRRPEARWRRRPEDVVELGPVQRDLLAAAWDSLVPGGALAYTTCSPHAEETVAVIRDVAGETPDVEGLPGLTVLDAPAVLAAVTGEDAAGFASAAVGTGRCAQLWPDRHGTDGMFLALLRKQA